MPGRPATDSDETVVPDYDGTAEYVVSPASAARTARKLIEQDRSGIKAKAPADVHDRYYQLFMPAG
jgi:hypothetical protein